MCLNQNNLCTISYRSIVYGLWMNVEQETSPNNSVDDYFECISECDVRE